MGSEGKGRTHGRAIFWPSTWWCGWRVGFGRSEFGPQRMFWIQFQTPDMPVVEAFVYVILELRRGLRPGMYIHKALAHG